MQTYIKKDLVDEVSHRTGLRHVDAAKAVDATFHVLRDLMEHADPECRIEIREFGVFEVKRTKAKPKARNPRTNELVYVPARKKTHFRPGKGLRTVLHQPLGEEDPGGRLDPVI